MSIRHFFQKRTGSGKFCYCYITTVTIAILNGNPLTFSLQAITEIEDGTIFLFMFSYANKERASPQCDTGAGK